MFIKKNWEREHIRDSTLPVKLQIKICNLKNTQTGFFSRGLL